MSWKRIITGVVVLVAVLLVGGLVAQDLFGGFRDEADRIEGELDRLRGANAKVASQHRLLARQLRALKGNPAVLEKAAREDLGFIRDGEIVVVLPR